MKAARLLPAYLPMCLLVGICFSVSGCALVPRSQIAQFQSEVQVLSEQRKAHLAEIENLKIHSENLGDQLFRTEEELGLLQEELGLDRQQIANYRRERTELHNQFEGLVGGHARIPAKVSQRLAELSQRYPSLQFDPTTGISKLDTDILFTSGDIQVKPGAEQVLGELVDVLKLPEAADLKIMVVGHTDNQRIAKKPAREKFPNNFHLSTSRALAVADLMQQHGLQERRIGVAGFGPHQPIAPNITYQDRQKNRRVEIFVINRDVPVVGWTDSIPTVYR
ncbi:MAG: OmpA family protein [Thermoguttaceae bacterium]